jgi:DNA-binding CsgD family transcriptional regulator
VTPLLPIDELKRMYVEDGMSTTEIANEIGAAQSGVAARLRRHGVTMRPRGGTSTGGHPSHRDLGPKVLRMHRAGKSSNEIANRLGCSLGTVHYHVHKNDPKEDS